MRLDNLKPAKGSTHSRKRIGRGEGSGHGDTATRGHKGAKSRSGYKTKIGFEGGQMPLQRRVPKFGFRNPNRVEYRGINLDSLQKLSEAKGLKDQITFQHLVDHGMAAKGDLVKILGRGEWAAKMTIEAHAFSASAKAAIEKAGGEAKTV